MGKIPKMKRCISNVMVVREENIGVVIGSTNKRQYYMLGVPACDTYRSRSRNLVGTFKRVLKIS